MEHRPADTSIEAWRVQSRIYAAMTPDQRIAMAVEMTEDARRISLAGIRHRHPQLTEREAEVELIRLLHGDEIAALAARL